MGKALFTLILAASIVAIGFAGTSSGADFDVGGKPLTVMGYVTQGTAFSITGKDRFDSPKDMQSALTNVFLESAYRPTDDIKLYVSGMFTADWIYDIKSNNREWVDKGFAKSRKHLYMDNEYWQLLKEGHVTWTPPNWNIRLGKQIVSWGETDGFRLMDQINPLDQRRGFSDVEFENSIIPTWLAKFEYFVPNKPSWIQDLGFEFVFNPNVTFIRNQSIETGNDKGGIWAPDANAVIGPPPVPEAHVGSANYDLDKPRAFNSSGYEYAFRVKSVISDAIITLNYYYGLDKDPVVKLNQALTSVDPTSEDGRPILHPYYEGRYPLFRFAGATFSRDITPLKASFLGNVAPVLRLEAFYAFNNTFATSTNEFARSDEIRWAAGVDWKVKVPLLNPRAYFTISPQYYQRRILDYPSDGVKFNGLYETNNTTTLMINTSYFHNKLTPSFFWMRDWSNRANFTRYQLVYDYSNEWHYTAGATLFSGEKPNQGFEVFHNKDQIYFKISYKFG